MFLVSLENSSFRFGLSSILSSPPNIFIHLLASLILKIDFILIDTSVFVHHWARVPGDFGAITVCHIIQHDRVHQQFSSCNNSLFYCIVLLGDV